MTSRVGGLTLMRKLSARRTRAGSSRSGVSPRWNRRRRLVSSMPRHRWLRARFILARRRFLLSTNSRPTARCAGFTGILSARRCCLRRKARLSPTSSARPRRRRASSRRRSWRRGRCILRTPAAGCIASTRRRVRNVGRWTAVRRRFPTRIGSICSSPRPSWRMARSSSAEARWSNSSLAAKVMRAARGGAFSWHSTRRRARSCGSTTSVRNRRSSTHPWSSKATGAATLSSMARRRARSGPRLLTMPNRTRCFSART